MILRFYVVYVRIALTVVYFLYVSFSRLITLVWEERAGFSAIVYRNFVVSVGRSFLCLWMLGKGCVILLLVLYSFVHVVRSGD